MGAPKKLGGYRHMLESVYSVIALLFILVACVELGDSAAAVDVYRLIQYDMSGSPFESRFAALNHHVASLHFPPGADLSRTVLIIPLREFNITLVRGLKMEGIRKFMKKRMKNVLAELEQLLIHANIPYPVYFSFENDEIHNVLADIKQNDAIGQLATATTGGFTSSRNAPASDLPLFSLRGRQFRRRNK
ncbi:hypothetical protein PTKIN_Ptkin03bG0069700 [Pterospermum kingtungense]